MTWILLGGLSLVTLVIVAVACSRFTRRSQDQIVESLGRVTGHQQRRHDQ